MLLEIRDASVNYAKVSAIRNISMAVPDGGIVTIIGGNGAGKTTTLRAISGLERLRAGEIHFDGERIDRLAPDRIVARGIAHGLAADLRVYSHLALMATGRLMSGAVFACFGTGCPRPVPRRALPSWKRRPGSTPGPAVVINIYGAW